jgi:single-stranded DNA-binding protein
MAVNHVVLIGTVADPGPKLTYSDAGRPECRLTLMVSEPSTRGKEDYRLFIPVFCYGTSAEPAAETLETGDLVAVDGKLSWSSKLKQDGSKLGLCVTTFSVEIITKAPAMAETAGSGKGEA